MAGDDWATSVLRDSEDLLICPVVVAELLSGFRRGTREAHNRRIMRRFLATPRVSAAPISLETAEFYCSVYEQLRKAGTPIPTQDIWIAACAMEQGAHLATTDEHFRRVAGLLTVFPDE
jgi:predicted nucleic acid-binding protein